jgi:6-phosphogluconolactonase
VPTVVYVACADSRDVYVARFDGATGAVTVVQRAAAPGSVGPLALHPRRTWLYAALRSEPFEVAMYAIDPAAGTLTFHASVSLPDNMAYVSTDPAGRFLFGASYHGNKIAVNPIGGDGLVDAQAVQVLSTEPHPHSILTDPAGRFVFVPCLGGDAILQYGFDAGSGRLTPNRVPSVAARPKAGPRHLVFHPTRPFAYCTNELDATVGAYRVDAAAGTLAPVETQTLLPSGFDGRAPFAAADLHVTPDGRFLYASERASNCLAAFRIDGETGALTPAGSFPTEEKPRGFNIDPAGGHLLTVGQASHHMTCYAIDAGSGRLTARHRYPMGRNPHWVSIVEIG